MSFQHLKEAIVEAPTVREGNYAFRAYPVGERGTNIDSKLAHEVVAGLANAVLSIDSGDKIDSIVSIHVTGAMWALPIALTMNKPLKLFTTEPNGCEWQESFEQKRLYLPRKIYSPDLTKVGRCVIIDDVLSGGGTITQMKEAIEKAGGKVLGAVCVIDKLGTANTLGNKLGISIIGLV